MAGIMRVEKEKNFTVMSNYHLNDDRLSWKSKGLLSYILSLPDDWKIYATELQKRSTDGKTSTDSAIKELVEYGYIGRTPTKEVDGKFSGYDYTVFEKPQRITRVGKPDNGKPDNGKSDTSNYLLDQELNELSTDVKNILSEQSSDLISKNKKSLLEIKYQEVLDLYQELDLPNFKKISKTRESKVKARIKEDGIENVFLVLKKASESDFLDKKKGWFSFDWIFNPTNFLKILEGNYDNNKSLQLNGKSNSLDAINDFAKRFGGEHGEDETDEETIEYIVID